MILQQTNVKKFKCAIEINKWIKKAEEILPQKYWQYKQYKTAVTFAFSLSDQ